MANYLDHAATTPLRPVALEAMLEWASGERGNASGSHRLARSARRAVDDARDVVAAALGCEPGEVVFTSGGTEADNLAVAGVLAARPGSHAVCSAIEHHAVLDPVMAAGGTTVPVAADGRLDLTRLAEVLNADTSIVSVMAVNNEIGTIQPLAEVAAVLDHRAPRAVLHTDAVQALPWLDLPAETSAAALISVSAHKVGGPAGVGALVVRSGTPLAAQTLGGGQERGRRSGSLNVPGIVGFAAAVEACVDERKAMIDRVRPLRDRLADGLLTTIPDSYESGVTGGYRGHKVAGSCHLCFRGVEAEALLFLLDQEDLAASAAASCASGAAEPSHVLSAIGVDRDVAGGSLRLSLGWTSTSEDVDRALEVVPRAVARIRGER